VLVGEAGIGKTLLLRAAAEAFAGPRFEGGGLATLRWRPYLPLTRALGDRGLDGDRAAAAASVRDAVGSGLLVLDDLHWADVETLSLLPLLSGRIELLAAVRTGDPGSARALEAVDAAGFERLELGPLDERHARRLLRTRAELESCQHDALLVTARGNPLLLLELTPAGDASPTLRVSLETRLSHCSDAAREALTVLALLGRPAPPELLGPGTRELIAAGLAHEADGALSPRHAVIAEATVAGTSAEERRALHSRLAAALADPGERARHFQAAGLHDEARECALRAAAGARRPGERAEHLRVAAACSSGEASDRLRFQAADALIEAGWFADARELADVVEGLDPEVRARACKVRGRASLALGDADAARQQLEAGLALADGSRAEVEVELRLERVRLALWTREPELLPLARSAFELAKSVGASVPLAHCLLAHVLYDPTASEEAFRHYRTAIDESARSGDSEVGFDASAGLVGALEALSGDSREALRVADTCRRRAQQLSLRGREIEFQWMVARLRYLYAGEYQRAIEELRACLDEPAIAYPNRAHVAADLAVALAHIGRPAESRAVLATDGAGESIRWVRSVRAWAGAEVELAIGRPQQALEIAEIAISEASSANVIFGVLLRDLACVELGLPPGPRPAGLVENRLNLYAHFALDGLMRMADERFEEAETLFCEAASSAANLRLYEELRWSWAAGEAARRAGDLKLARRHLLGVEERATALGLEPLLARVRRSLRLAGLRRSTSARNGSGSLTPREREVLQHVGAGETSGQIGRRLGIAPATVDTMVKTSMQKLGARTRRQAAALVSRLPE
jgi:DNA-binding CsgD family transcriptional regulator